MTAAQKARLQGFNTSLNKRGVLLNLDGTVLSFNALVQPFTPDPGEYSVGNETRSASKVHILRDTAGIEQIGIGAVLTDAESATSHRVTQIEDHPANIAVVFHCETASD